MNEKLIARIRALSELVKSNPRGCGPLLPVKFTDALDAFADELVRTPDRPIDMVLYCPACGLQHIDAPEPSMLAEDAAMLGGDWPGRWTNPPHRSHLCHGCAHTWRPADVPTNGVYRVQTRGENDSLVIGGMHAGRAAP